MLSLITLTALLSISACSHFGKSDCKSKQACCKEKCDKKEKCHKKSCDKKDAPACHKEVKKEEQKKS